VNIQKYVNKNMLKYILDTKTATNQRFIYNLKYYMKQNTLKNKNNITTYYGLRPMTEARKES